MPETPGGEPPRWPDAFENVRKVYPGLWIVCRVVRFGGRGRGWFWVGLGWCGLGGFGVAWGGLAWLGLSRDVVCCGVM